MSRNSDPFPLVKGEVEKSVAGVTQTYEQWKHSLAEGDPSTIAFYRTELESGVNSIDWDLGDLDEAIEIARKETRFGITEQELQARQAFVHDTRQTVSDIRAHLAEAKAMQRNTEARNQHASLIGSGNSRQNDRYAALDAAIEEDNRQFVQAHQEMQQDMYEDQEAGLQELSTAFTTLHHMGEQMTDELDRQKKMLEETEEEITSTSKRVGRAIRRTDDLLNRSKSKWGWIMIIVLVVALLITFLLILVV